MTRHLRIAKDGESADGEVRLATVGGVRYAEIAPLIQWLEALTAAKNLLPVEARAAMMVVADELRRLEAAP